MDRIAVVAFSELVNKALNCPAGVDYTANGVLLVANLLRQSCDELWLDEHVGLDGRELGLDRFNGRFSAQSAAGAGEDVFEDEGSGGAASVFFADRSIAANE